MKEYLVDLNATQAAIRAGYSRSTAGVQGYENLKKPYIQEAIQEAFEKRSKKVELTAEYVIEGLMEVNERCLQRKPVMEWSHKDKQMVQSTDEDGNNLWMFDSAGANKALKSLGEHLGLFKKVFASDPEKPLFPPVQVTVVRPEDVKNANKKK